MVKSELALTFTYRSSNNSNYHVGTKGYTLTSSDSSSGNTFKLSDSTLSWSRKQNTRFGLFSARNVNSPNTISKEALLSGLGSKFGAIDIASRDGKCCLPISDIGKLASINENDHTPQTLTLTFQSSGPEPFQASPLQLAKSSNTRVYSQKDVVVLFVRAGRSTQRVWTTMKLLKNSSEHYRTLFDSGFLESEGTSATPVIQLELLDGTTSKDTIPFEDSDDEHDSISDEAIQPEKIYRIYESQTSYKTYRAFVFFLETGTVKFSSLKSSIPLSGSDTMVGRPEQVPEGSPKSLYRLAHFLDIKSLRKLALENFCSQLTTENVVQEIFSQASIVYTELNEVAFKFAKGNLTKVLRSEGKKKLVARFFEDDLSEEEKPLFVKLLDLGR